MMQPRTIHDRTHRFRLALPLLLSLALAAPAARAQGGPALVVERVAPRSGAGDARRVVLELGRYDALRGGRDLQQVGVTYRPDVSIAGFHPEAGVMVSGASAVYAHVGVGRDLPIGDLVVVRPSVGVGAYRNGTGKDLGHPVEFRSGVEVSVAVGDGRVGIELFHLSNAHLAARNPGEESLVVAYSVPVGALLASPR